MKIRSKRKVPTVQRAVEDVVLEVLAMQSGDSVFIERRFPGGAIKFACRDVQVTRKEVKQPGTEEGGQSGH